MEKGVVPKTKARPACKTFLMELSFSTDKLASLRVIRISIYAEVL